MTENEPLIRNISDTALWVAMYRARETDRPDALFRDPLARRLAGERGAEIEAATRKSTSNPWPFVTRTVLFDSAIAREVRAGADVVVNLACGLDTRPYRMDVPPSLLWIEVDLPGIIDEKERVLCDERPRCAVERVRLDLADVAARSRFLDGLGARGRRIVFVSEGLIIYLTREQVAELATDLARVPTAQRWILDLATLGLLKWMQRRLGKHLEHANAPFLFGPEEGVEFFTPLGWGAVDVQSMFKAAGKLGRLPLIMRLFSLLPEPTRPRPNQPWSGVCVFERA